MSSATMPEVLGNLWSALCERIPLSDVLFDVLILVSIGALWCVDRAKKNLELESSVLKNTRACIDQLKERFERGEVHMQDAVIRDSYDALVKVASETDASNRLDSSAAVQRYLYGKSEGPLHTGYVSDRLYAIICSVSSDNLVRKVPPLQDLHELTMQRERGGKAAAGFRILTPSILVLGILGTLLGVHEKLTSVSGGQGISALAEALQPGAVAVFCTVLVMFFRSRYNKALSKFISEFNEYTLTCLLPFFRPVSQSQDDVSKLEQAMENAAGSYAQLQELWKSVSEYKTHLSSFESESVTVLTHLCDNISKLDTALKHYGLIYEMEQDWEKASSPFAVQLLRSYHRLRYILNEWGKCMQASDEKVAALYEQNFMPVLQATLEWYRNCGFQTALEECHNNLKACVEQEFEMPQLSTQRNQLQRIMVWQEKLDKQFADYSRCVDDIDRSDREIDEKISELDGVVSIMGDAESGVVTRLNACYEKVKAESALLKNAFCAESREMVEPELLSLFVSLKEKKEKYGTFNHYYPSGLRGFKMKCKYFIMSLRESRLFRRSVWGVFAISVLWFVLLRCFA